jgi:hypothetical protein
MTAQDQLHGWKDIAAFLGRTVRTVQRWQRLGLPIRRVEALSGGVYAVKSELQQWRDGAAGRPVRLSATLLLREPLPPGRYTVLIEVIPETRRRATSR